MATTKAKADDSKNPVQNEKDKVHLGASGGLAAEGHGLINRVGSPKVVDGVVERGAEGDHERFVEANKFQQSKVEFAKKVEKDKKDLAAGKDPHAVKDVVTEQQKKQDAEAAKKPTAAGAETNLNNPAVVQTAKETEKQEAKDLKAANADAPNKDKK